jgi:2-isopropylmalate synthase
VAISDSFHIYDTTLRDGAQQEGLNLSVHDKLTIARHLDDLGVGFIEGGWPGANPKDTEFFKLGGPIPRQQMTYFSGRWLNLERQL